MGSPLPEDLRILIVEDMPEDAEMVVRTIRKAGLTFEKRIVDNGPDCLEALRSFEPHLILTDYSMPQFTGMDVIRIRDENSPGTPLIIVTGSINEETAAACIKTGADDYLTKDHIKRLITAIEGVFEKKKYKDEKAEVDAALRNAGAQWQSTFDAIPSAIFLVDKKGTIHQCNRAMSELLGLPMHKIVGSAYWERVHETREPIPGCPVQRLLETGKHQGWVLPIGERVFEVTAAPRFDNRGELIGAVLILNDSTEKTRAEETRREQTKLLQEAKDTLEARVEERTRDLERSQGFLTNMNASLQLKSTELQGANEKLLELDRLKSMFLAGTSHELRTPLNSILGFTGIMLNGMTGELNEEQHRQMSMVHASATHLLALINDLLDVSKIEVGKIDLNIEEFDVAATTRDLTESFSAQAEAKQLDLVCSAPEPVRIASDEGRVRQIITNLVGNALKFTTQGGLTISVAGDEGMAKISIRDTGVGIRPEKRDLLFRSFSRVEEKGIPHREGTGLGLYLSQKIAHLLGGSIEVKSEFGEGSVFTLTLPSQ